MAGNIYIHFFFWPPMLHRNSICEQLGGMTKKKGINGEKLYENAGLAHSVGQ